MPEIIGTPTVEAAEAHGFSIEILIGPYPPQARKSHRRAVYAKLRPIDERIRAAMERVTGKDLILGSAELTADGLATILHGDEQAKEAIAATALRPALREAKKVHDAVLGHG